ncbi:helix-turn-helix transcriptional regulator [Paraburkholderia hospita]|jgi:predicted DNA-binding transcriptional regulator YafY|uniref:Helix-turn-helix type 11 domain-containing protein n=1 Tax=Paraburkholderia hospita TaxID=169430 RepID=A0ABP2P8T1_9BURK|nr:YafY family protein [Paraburkholderia hospita]EUC14873.1 WYL domain containing protein [Burkholderia sp. BT03]SOE63139.1 HTH domain-containing protein [Burkholderia sp. YR290]EIM93951.1 helix-turn-helix type 11 domain-containing protein [Paraburkholderia hospita]OUL81705.1 DNA-binding transcriptional regulator [Paraburkholderia hospita]OUL84763.1 DNA-binding transcriptional regulator [Paraburkholderia hospita]
MTRRADRLFQIAELLRGRRLTTAQQLADWLHVSLRTVYRDVQDLQLSGVPIEGEPGIGYRLSRSASLPPLTFTAEELTALAAGARMLESWGGESMAAGARGALAKIASAMPADKRATIDRLAFFAPSFHVDGNVSVIVDTLHRAIDSRRVVSFAYLDKNGAATQRRVWPLALAYWGARFTLGAWCELRGDFRHFALTNIGQLDVLEPFPDVEGRRLADFMRSIGVKAR